MLDYRYARTYQRSKLRRKEDLGAEPRARHGIVKAVLRARGGRVSLFEWMTFSRQC